jgi:hypothetical protein
MSTAATIAAARSFLTSLSSLLGGLLEFGLGLNLQALT